MIEVGNICEVNGKKARVAIGSMVTDFLPVLQFANSFAIHWKPLRVDEQCIVLPIRGDLNSGIILRGISSDSFNFQDTKDNEEIVVFEDGASISYNTDTSTLNILNGKIANIDVKDSVNINAKKNVNINATTSAKIVSPNVDIEATNTTIKSTNISLLGAILMLGSVVSKSNEGPAQFMIDGELEVSKLKATQEIKTDGNVIDAKGDLTNHSNNGLMRD
ncbi:baseplate assembly protein [Aliarcobacter skirrowii]|uniref:phage baseplate assembly protein V n=1 Tax=Aliarcobacter skirrowii TaxID=28200 RepID=UPI00100AA0E8|nr:phage baseplate assembly protein V [Aliarcobacter skirrowii]RXJ80809.1 baseplate assembly protein [Aliarcobacter skirrowii]